MKKIIALLITAMMLTTIFAVCVSANEDLISPLAAGKELVNVAPSSTYVIATDGTWRPDADGYTDGVAGEHQKLIDGNKNTNDGGSAFTASTGGGNVEVTVTLDKEYTALKKFNIDHLFFNWGIGAGESVEYLVSTDGENYTSVGIVTTEDAINGDYTNDKGEGWKGTDYILELDEAVTAKFIKIKFTGSNYLWASEFEIYNEQEADVEDSSSAAPSSEEPTTETSDAGYIAIAIIAIISFAAVTVAKKLR